MLVVEQQSSNVEPDMNNDQENQVDFPPYSVAELTGIIRYRLASAGLTCSGFFAPHAAQVICNGDSSLRRLLKTVHELRFSSSADTAKVFHSAVNFHDVHAELGLE